MISGMAQEPAMGMVIRRARERLRWTQQQLADALGVALRTVNDWENDRSYPRSSVGALEEVLGISLGGTGAAAPWLPPALLRQLEQLKPGQAAYVIVLLSRRAAGDAEPAEADPGAA